MKIRTAAAAGIIAAGYSLIPTAVLRARNALRPGTGEKIICLTFDDGPSAEYTPELLDLLAEYDVKASFFEVAEFARENPDIVRRINAEGHVIALHSLRHESPLIEGPAKTRKNMADSLRIMNDLGVRPKYFRPAWGTFNTELIRQAGEAGMKTVLWNVMIGDWEKNVTAGELRDRLARKIRRPALVCLHDGRGSEGAPGRMIAALSKMLPVWKEKGYSFVTIEEYYDAFCIS
ncbi:MAG: polysaccharide deacetylase family protein [Anaerovoracaceae bacterium]|jgi:peptidoglycan/xylan/chitin deacetylase (PgdA/CDA1 family)